MQTIIVDMTPGFRMPTIYYSQGDVGTQFAIDLRSRFGDSFPAGTTVTIQATKPSGFGFSVAATSVTNGVATFTTTAEMTDEFGRFPAELKVTKTGLTLFSANFYMDGEENTHPDGTIDGQQETVIPELAQLVERVEDAASSVLDMTVVANTLPAGSDATYSYDEETNTATFGIPKGADGSLASGVLAPTYSSSSTYAVGDYVYYSGSLYRCTTAITTAEAWTSGHWTQVALAPEVSDLKSDLNDETTSRLALASRVTTAESDIDTLETHKVAQPLDEYNQPTDGTNGQSLRTKGDGTTEWVDVGLPTDEQTAQAVSDWLDEHPEATTTVQDGSLTEAKFTDALKLKTIKDYVTPQMFGAKADGVTDDTAAIQACFDAVENGGTIYFPKIGGLEFQPHYKITETIILSKNDVTVLSEATSEYQEGLFSDSSITLLKITGYGCSINNLAFMGNGEVYRRSGTNGLLFDRRGLGDEETYSNIDCKITNCNFAFLDDCVHVCGKNALISDNLFSNSIRGVVVSQHTYESGGTTIGSELKGIRVFDNRFHSIGQYYFPLRTEMTAGDYPTDITEVDSWCVELPTDIVSNQVFNGIEIINNLADICFGGFYKGTLVGVRIANNAYVYGSALLCYCPSSNTALSISRQIQSIIEGNTVYGYPQTARPDRGYSVMFANNIVINDNDNLKITNNSLKICGETSIKLFGCARVVLNGNFINNSNRFFVEDAIQRSVVIVTNCSKAVISDNFIDSQYGTASEYGFEISGGSNIGYINNYVFGGVEYETNENTLIPIYEKPFTATQWTLPTLLNSFELNSPYYGHGYRRTSDGYVEICLYLTGGIDNKVAFTLPPYYRPNTPIMLMSRSTGQHDINIVIDTAGNVTLNDLQTASDASLSGIILLNFRFPIQ